LEVIDGGNQTNTVVGEGTQATPEPATRIRSYLFALDPQDALLLKHLKDTGAIFDIVLRAPTSTVEFELTPVTEEYLIELYGLDVLP
jgi:pilus assembly protein CpaB